MKQKKSSKRWLERHINDEYVKLARQQGYRSRAAFKLIEINERDILLKAGITVVDLGAAPGGWSQVARKKIGKRGKVFALDILEMDPIPEVNFIQGDFRENSVLEKFVELLGDAEIDLVISDMSPNVTGVSTVDQPRSMYLCELVLDFSRNHLKKGGTLALKVFQGEGFDGFVREMRESFNKLVTRKPKASRSQSREVYLVGSNYKGL